MNDSHAWVTLFSSSVVVLAPTLAAVYNNYSRSKSLENSLISEVKSIRIELLSYNLHAELIAHLMQMKISKKKEVSITIPVHDKYNIIYTKNAENIGMLPPYLSGKITSFYMIAARLVTALNEVNGLFIENRISREIYTIGQYIDELAGVIDTFDQFDTISSEILNHKQKSIPEKITSFFCE